MLTESTYGVPVQGAELQEIVVVGAVVSAGDWTICVWTASALFAEEEI